MRGAAATAGPGPGPDPRPGPYLSRPKIKELRNYASQELGQNFDLREFHDTILWSGELPLDLLEQNIKNWIEVKKAS